MPSDVLITPASSKIDFTDGANATKTLKITGTSLNIDTSFAIGATTANNTLSVLGSASIGSAFNVAAPTNGLIVQGDTGIGTSSFVYSNANRGVLEIYGTTDSLIALKNATANSYLQKSGNDFYLVNGGAGIIAINTNGLERWRITSAGVLQSNGAQTVQTNTGNLTLASAAGNGNIFLLPNGTGSVGVGTNSPTQFLDVRGNIKLGADGAGSYIYYVKDNEGTIINTSRSDVSQQGLFRSDGWGNFTVDKSIGIGYSLGSSFASSAIGNGNLYVLNSIGINTTSPLTKLDVRTGSITSGTAASTSGSTIIAGYYSNTAGVLTVLGTEQASGGPVLGYAVTPSTSATGAFLSSTTITIPRSAYTQDGGTHRWYIGASQTVAIGGAVTVSEVMRINSNGNLGIGITSPTAKLEIASNVAAASTPASALTFSNQSDGGHRILFKSSTGNLVAIDGDVTSTGGGTDDGVFKVFTSSNGSLAERMRITSNGLVGIGTTSPVGELDVYDNVNGASISYYRNVSSGSSAYIALLLGNDQGNNKLVMFTNSSTRTTDGGVGNSTIRTDSGKLYLGAGATQHILDTTGNVGIGNTSPNNKLAISGSVSIGSGYNTAAPTNGLLVEGSVGIGLTNPSYKLDVGAVGSGSVSVRLTPGYERVRYYGFDLLGYNDGNLWMMGNNPTNTLLLSNNWDWDYQIAISYTPSTIGAAGGSLEIGQMTKNNANFTHGNTRFYTNGIERLRIINNGNVGIGISSPAARLHVNSTTSGATLLRTDGTNGTLFSVIDDLSDSLMSVNNSAGLPVLEVFADDRVVAGQYGANDFVISGNKVGIGTASPSSKLHIYENANRVTYITQNNNHTARFEAYGTATAIDTTASNGIFFRINGGDIVKFAADGNVGIGSATPAYKLYVNGNGYFNSTLQVNSNITLSGGGDVIINDSDGTGTFNSFMDSGVGYIRIDDGGSANGTLNINSGTLFVGPSSGNVGIGVTSPSVKLAVDGEASFGDGSKLTLIGLDINSGVTPNFIKIRTKIPFTSGAADFTINIKGFRYGSAETANLSICWHYYDSTFYNPAISSAGSFAPTVKLSAEDWDSSGTPKVCIVLVGPGYWPKLYVESMYSSSYNDEYADGWNWVDADATGTGDNLAILSYKSNFGNNFVMLGNGNVGIGAVSPKAKLDSYFSLNAITFNYLATNLNGNSPIPVYGFDVTSGVETRSIKAGIGYERHIENGRGTLHIYNRSSGDTSNISGNRSTAGDIKMSIDNSGNVGIGITVPTSLLDVNGIAVMHYEEGQNQYSFRGANRAINDWDYSGLTINPTYNDYGDGSWYIDAGISNDWDRGILSKRRFRRVEGLTLEYETFTQANVGTDIYLMIGFVGGNSVNPSYNQTPANLTYQDNAGLSVYTNGSASGTDYNVDTRNAWWRFKTVLKGAGAFHYIYRNSKWNLIKETSTNNQNDYEYVRVLFSLYRQRVYIRDLKVYVAQQSYRGANYIDNVVGNLSVAGYLNAGGQTVNGESFYQWEGATYRNPADHTPRLLLRKDNSSTEINGFAPALALYNNNGGDQTTVGMVFVSAEAVSPTQGNAVNLAGIIAKKESTGTAGGWSKGSLNFFVKDHGSKVDALTIQYTGKVGIGTTNPATLVQIGTGTPTADTGGIQFGSDTTARIYRITSSTIQVSNNLTVGGTITGNLTGNATNVTGTVAIANGGSGQTSAQAAMNAFAGAVTSGSYLRGNGTNVVMSAIQAADVPTLNQNTTGSSGSCTGNAASATNASQLGGAVAAKYVRTDTDGTAGDMFSLVTVTKSLTVTTSWIDTGISAGSDLFSGAYILTLNVDNYAVSGGHYNETYTGIMYWYAGATNSVNYDEIPLHKSGHAPNGAYINLRTLRGVSGVLKLQIISSVVTSGASNYIFKFRRMI